MSRGQGHSPYEKFIRDHQTSEEPTVKVLNNILTQEYRVTARFTNKDGIGNIELLGEESWKSIKLAYRSDKHSDCKLFDGVEIIEGSFSNFRGSNAYPLASFKENSCVLRFNYRGIPRVATGHPGYWKMEILSLEPIQK